MIQLQNNLFVRPDLCRTLAPLSPIRENRRSLQELADVAVCLEEPRIYSPAISPTSSFSTDYTSSRDPCMARLRLSLLLYLPNGQEKQSQLPVNPEEVMTLFAIADRERERDRPHLYDGYYSGTHANNNSNNNLRRPSSGSEYSWQGSTSSAAELSPHLSTAHTSPTLTPVSSGCPLEWHSILPIPPQSSLKIDVRLAGELNSLEEQNRRRLELARSRRPSARQAPYAPASARSRRNSKHQQQQQQHHQHYQQHAAEIACAMEDGRERKPHFNQPYTRSVKLFILYYKDDCKYGWPAINARRVELLPVLLGSSYKREVEENRKVAGINGFYYRLNAMMPALTPDGSGLLFMEKDGRYWEFTESSKCRTSSSASSTSSASSSSSSESSAASSSASSSTPTRSDARPRGMVDRYPEEVLHYWEEYVRHFVPPEKHAEIYARAKKYSDIRAEQRREKGVPQWTPDNEAERVVHKNPPDGKSKASKKGSNTEERALREMMSACVLNPTR
ncbi:hypothetical protein VP1G_06813 [Cytospora mali]|uniref:Uncharacterized protein n=1 Tax=Cytospora mali TaxID=578113 RepID=A0A194V6F2_CYTMA|nr:hypothetical protein VP1G_06813 [Valsa mali var. pyri (nom. inval.)]